ncbi:hypothetical protein [Rhodopirellula sp. MGV]|uniref:hypothetical protein n=1 Tax=Rhodopirellula sp. MGV TaxID=2023130 RepID=UPI000B975534|nr:hypothetical protein [Rhodopirellula sp. MGV]OYP35034.1 hypothetical protein CGZ80_13595 [Rhodopirellula sp. MGV]PNY35799.1 hypothetical protein C2E31_16340 [Rhodopirellula baltica]
MQHFRPYRITIEHRVKQWRWLARLKRTRQIRDHWLWIHETDQATPVRSAEKRCLLDLRKVTCDGEQGRRFHALVSLLSRGGYQVFLVPRLEFLQTGNRLFKASALQIAEPLTDAASDQHFDLCLTDHRGEHPQATQTIQLVSNAREPVWPTDLEVPYSFYPLIWDNHEDARFEAYRNQTRQWRLFFGGHCSQKAYHTIRFYHRLQPVDRHTVINDLLASYSGDTIQIESDQQLDTMMSHRHDGFVMIDNDRYRTDASQWLRLLSNASFFVAAPGCDYPFSHNAIESIAIGTIPLLEYDSLFTPHLIDGVNCVAYRGRTGLRDAVRRINAMSESKIATMRQAVIDYYEDHLSPHAFCGRLETQSPKRIHLYPYLAPVTKAA